MFWLARLFKGLNKAVSAAVRFLFFLPESRTTPIQQLRIERHHRHCIAIPFPRLRWNSGSIKENLEELYDFGIQTANGALDWYLENRTTKKRYAKSLHRVAYILAIIGAALPLAKLSTLTDAPFIRHLLNISESNSNSIVAELSLAFFGAAAGLTLIDRMAGFSADWMRYVITATQINRARMQFQFDWDRLNRTLPYDAPHEQGETRGKKTQDPVGARIKLIQNFVLIIADLTEKETSGWATDLKERVAQLDSQLPRRGKA